MESLSSEINDTKSRNNEDNGEAHLKWRCEYGVMCLLFKVIFNLLFFLRPDLTI